LFAVILLSAVSAALPAFAEPRAGIDYHKGRAIVRFTLPVADRIDYYLEGAESLAWVCGDDSVGRLLARFGVDRMRRFLPSIDHVMRNRGNRSPSRAYWDHRDAVNRRFAGRFARAPRWARHVPMYGVFVLTFHEATDVWEVCRAFAANPHVEYAEPQPVWKFLYTPNDPQLNSAWGVLRIGSTSAWDSAKGSNTVVAVVDTGVDQDHEDLVNVRWVNQTEFNGSSGNDDDGNGFVDDIYGYDFGDNDGNPNDTHGHGTHCSGTVGAEGDNSRGVAGVAYQTRIMCIKVFGGSSAFPDPFASGLQYALDEGADVASNSWGQQAAIGMTSYINLLDNMVSGGCIPVFSAGNDNQDGATHYPSAFFSAVSVAATTNTDSRASFSCYGIQLDVTAPGQSIISTTNNGSYGGMSGTSMSCPHVSGALALFVSYLNSQSITLTTEQIRQVLRQSTTDLEQPGYDPWAGYGLLDVNGMVNFSNLNDVCEARISSPHFLAPVSGTSITITGIADCPGNASAYSGYSLDYAAGRPWDTDTWTNITTSTGTVSSGTPPNWGTGTLHTWDVSGLSDGRYTLRLTVSNTSSQTFTDRMEFVLDNISDQNMGNAYEVFASPTTAEMTYARNLDPATDEDWFKLELVSGQEYIFFTNNLAGNSDTELFLYRSNGTTQVAHNDDWPQDGLKNSRIVWTCDNSGTYYLRVIAFGQNYQASYDLRMTGLFKDAFEGDNTSAAAQAHTVAQTTNHSIVPAGDVDWASFSATQNTIYTVRCSELPSGTVVRIVDTDGSTVLDSESAADSEGYWVVGPWTCPANGTYYVEVDASGATGTGHYALVIYGGEDVLFQDDFQTVDNNLWSAVAGSWGINSGRYRQSNTANNAHIAVPSVPAWTDFVVEGVLNYRSVNDPSNANIAVIGKYYSSDQYLVGRIRANGNVELARYHEGSLASVLLNSVPFSSSTATDYKVRLEFRGSVINLFVDGKLYTSAVNRWYAGGLALRSFGNESRFDDIKVFRYVTGSPTPLSVDTGQLPDAEVLASYSQSVTASGGSAPRTFSQIGGTLPTGLSLASDGTVSGTPTTLGSTTFDVKVADNAQRVAARRVQIDVVDTADPVITINAPTDQDEVGTSTVGVDVDITDFQALSTAEFRVGTGSWQNLTFNAGDNYTGTATLSAGWNTIEIHAVDGSGNESTDSVDVEYDDTPPVLNITSHTDGEYTFTADITLSGTSADAVTITVNSQAATLDGGTGNWSRALTLVPGPNTIDVQAVDEYSRTTDVSITVHLLLWGDVDLDLDVDEDDALLAAQAEAGLTTLAPMQAACGDVDHNGTVDIRDAYAIRRAAVGYITLE
jgi:subtilisin family serine protease